MTTEYDIPSNFVRKSTASLQIKISTAQLNFSNRNVIYTTKIDGVVCPPNISETIATRIVKLAHRPCIASTMIKLISKLILLPILLILVKTIQSIRIYLYDSSCCPNHVPLGQVSKPFTQCLLMRQTRVCCIHASCTVSTSSAKVLCNRPSYVIYLT